jgi:ribose 5-phosphate isomerase B
MSGLRLAIGADHAGFALKERLAAYLAGAGHAVEDLGARDATPSDYPDYARAVCLAVTEGRADLGVLCCGTGIGMEIAANKVNGIRAAKCGTEYEAELARGHNDANVLTLGGRVQTPEVAERILRTFIATRFEGGRHGRRVKKLMEMEKASH